MSVIVYYQFMDSSRLSFGFNIVTQLMFTGIVCIYATMNEQTSKKDKLLFYYVAILSIARAFYTSFCVYAAKSWILYNTDVFGFIISVTFYIYLFYLATLEK